jgi:hypothetical protein
MSIATGGTEGPGRRRPGLRSGANRCLSHGFTMDDYGAAAWVQGYDAAWLGQDWRRLAHYLAVDVNFVPYGSSTILVGRKAVIAHLREFLTTAEVHEYNATDLRGRAGRGVALVSYRWQLEWTGDGRRCAAEGRDLLSLRSIDGHWQMIWRLQLRP